MRTNRRGREMGFEDAELGGQMLAKRSEICDVSDPIVERGAGAMEIGADGVFGDLGAGGDVHGRVARGGDGFDAGLTQDGRGIQAPELGALGEDLIEGNLRLRAAHLRGGHYLRVFADGHLYWADFEDRSVEVDASRFTIVSMFHGNYRRGGSHEAAGAGDEPARSIQLATSSSRVSRR